jgi:hypothetical protein
MVVAVKPRTLRHAALTFCYLSERFVVAIWPSLLSVFLPVVP